ncbi:MAG: DNA cytosine methyltransferase, partial [Aridibacter sp.]
KKGVYGEFIETLKRNDYFLSDTKRIVSCAEYGVPQKRKRLVLLASKFGEIDLIPPIFNKQTAPTVRQAIGDLPKIEDGEIYENDPFHRAQKLSLLNKRRIQATNSGGSWRDWSDDLKLKCHKKLSGKTFGDVYGRMGWDDQAPTLTTHCTGLGNGRFGHPEQDRAISLREAAILQSFPPKYKFSNPESNDSEEGNVTYTQLQRHIGNAVPVELGRAISKSVKQHLQNYFE